MILHVQKKANLAALQDFYRAYAIEEKDYYVLITPSSLKEVDESHQADIIASFPMDSDIQLASRKYISTTREIKFSDTLTIGGATNHTMMITGPCSVESEEQIDQVAKFCVEQGIQVLRAGCYKPRTSPYTFQGLGHKGLILLAKMRDKYGLKIINTFIFK